jgi:hypothetical protein
MEYTPDVVKWRPSPIITNQSAIIEDCQAPLSFHDSMKKYAEISNRLYLMPKLNANALQPLLTSINRNAQKMQLPKTAVRSKSK